MPRRRGDTDEMAPDGDQIPEGAVWNEQSEEWDYPDNPPQDGDQPDEINPPELTDPPADPPAEPTEDDKIMAAAVAAIEGYSEAPAELIEATTPVRKRGDLQRAMDAVAVRAYAAWVERDRPSVWGKLPVITYYLDPEQVPEWKKLIRKACEFVTPQGDASGVRARFGRSEFVLTEEQAAKIGRPDDAGKTVLSWAAIDKRKSNRGENGDASEHDDGDDE